MQSPVVSVTKDTTVRELARLLSDEEISGCPVTEPDGTVVGVVSATDVMRAAAEEADVHLASARILGGAGETEEEEGDDAAEAGGFFLPEVAPGWAEEPLAEMLESDLDSMTVVEIMTPVTFSVEPTTDVVELAGLLMSGRIHRAVVLEDDRLVGIVTSHDVLRAVAEGSLTPAAAVR